MRVCVRIRRREDEAKGPGRNGYPPEISAARGCLLALEESMGTGAAGKPEGAIRNSLRALWCMRESQLGPLVAKWKQDSALDWRPYPVVRKGFDALAPSTACLGRSRRPPSECLWASGCLEEAPKPGTVEKVATSHPTTDAAPRTPKESRGSRDLAQETEACSPASL